MLLLLLAAAAAGLHHYLLIVVQHTQPLVLPENCSSGGVAKVCALVTC
jgi:hypothetical protein